MQELTIIGIGASIVTTLVAVVRYQAKEYEKQSKEKVNIIVDSNDKLVTYIENKTAEKFDMLTNQMNASEERCKVENEMLLALMKESRTNFEEYKESRERKMMGVVTELSSQINHLAHSIEGQSEMIKKVTS